MNYLRIRLRFVFFKKERLKRLLKVCNITDKDI